MRAPIDALIFMSSGRVPARGLPLTDGNQGPRDGVHDARRQSHPAAANIAIDDVPPNSCSCASRGKRGPRHSASHRCFGEVESVCQGNIQSG